MLRADLLEIARRAAKDSLHAVLSDLARFIRFCFWGALVTMKSPWLHVSIFKGHLPLATSQPPPDAVPVAQRCSGAYIYIYIYIYIYLYMYICIHIYINIYIYDKYIYIYIYIYIYMYICQYMSTYVYIYICIYICVCVCVFVYIYIYVHTYRP